MAMRQTMVSWLDREFIRLSGQSEPGLDAAEATRALLGRFEAQLGAHGLSLDHTVRTRLFARDRLGREQGTAVRRELLSNRARGVSSSFIAPALLGSNVAVALDLVAQRPSQASAEKILQEYEPPRAPLRYLVYEGVVFLSGVTSRQPTLEQQVAEILAEETESLALAGSSWERAVLVSCFLHSSQDVGTLWRLLRQSVPIRNAVLECESVEGYASEGCLLEIEATAVR
jgi:enamine deaminase RidA (YjgF/YER057c/UK114 family)